MNQNKYAKKFLGITVGLVFAFILGMVGVSGIFTTEQSIVSCFSYYTDDGNYNNSKNGGSTTLSKKDNDSLVRNNLNVGDTAILTATPADGYSFAGFFSNENFDETSFVSDSNPYEFEVSEKTELYAQFAKNYDITLNVEIKNDDDSTYIETIRKTCYFGQDIEISEIIEEELGEEVAQNYKNSTPVLDGADPSDDQTTPDGLTLDKNKIKVGAGSTVLAVGPSDPQPVGVSAYFRLYQATQYEGDSEYTMGTTENAIGLTVSSTDFHKVGFSNAGSTHTGMKRQGYVEYVFSGSINAASVIYLVADVRSDNYLFVDFGYYEIDTKLGYYKGNNADIEYYHYDYRYNLSVVDIYINFCAFFKEKETFNISYYNNGGSGSAPQSSDVLEGDSYQISSNSGNLQYPFKIFAGWNTKADGTGTKYAVNENIIVTEDLELYAEWQDDTASPPIYHIWLNPMGGSGSSVRIFEKFNVGFYIGEYGYASTLMTADSNPIGTPTKTGYTFNGFYTGKNGTGIKILTNAGYISSSAQATYFTETDKDIYASWTPLQYTLTFDVNGGNTLSPSSKTVNYDEGYGELPFPTKDNNSFEGWYTAASGGTEVTHSTVCNGNATIYAQWTPIIYEISLKQNDGTTTSNGYIYEKYGVGYFKDGDCTNQITTATSTAITLPTAPEGKYFGGYFDGAGGTGNEVLTSLGCLKSGVSTTKFSANSSIYAKWLTERYTINFDSNEGNAITGASYAYGVGLPTSEEISRTGYTFNGWCLAETSNNGTGTLLTTCPDMGTNGQTYTLYAQWTAKTYTLTYDINYTGGESIGQKTVTYGQAYGTLATPNTRANHRFDGWYTAASGGTQVGGDDVCYGAITLYAHWTQNQWNPIVNVYLGDSEEPEEDFSAIVTVTIPEIVTLDTTFSVTVQFASAYQVKQDGGVNVLPSVSIGEEIITLSYVASAYTAEDITCSGEPTLNIYAQLVPKILHLIIEGSGTVEASVTRSGSDVTVLDGGVVYLYEDVTISATPSTGYIFEKMMSYDSLRTYSPATYRVEDTIDCYITITFTAITYNVVFEGVHVGMEGYVAGTTKFTYGTEPTINFTLEDSAKTAILPCIVINGVSYNLAGTSYTFPDPLILPSGTTITINAYGLMTQNNITASATAGSSGNPYKLSTKEDLDVFSLALNNFNVDYTGLNYVLGNDIEYSTNRVTINANNTIYRNNLACLETGVTINGYTGEHNITTGAGIYKINNIVNTSWNPISSFAGTLDGNGYSLIGLNVLNATIGEGVPSGNFSYDGLTDWNGTYYPVTINNDSAGLFANLAEGAVIKNLGIENSFFASRQNVGAFAATSNNTYIRNCHVDNVYIYNCREEGTEGNLRAGGFIGYQVSGDYDIANSYINNSKIVTHNNNTSRSEGYAVGSILGYCSYGYVSYDGGTPSTERYAIENCYANCLAFVKTGMVMSGGFLTPPRLFESYIQPGSCAFAGVPTSGSPTNFTISDNIPTLASEKSFNLGKTIATTKLLVALNSWVKINQTSSTYSYWALGTDNYPVLTNSATLNYTVTKGTLTNTTLTGATFSGTTATVPFGTMLTVSPSANDYWVSSVTTNGKDYYWHNEHNTENYVFVCEEGMTITATATQLVFTQNVVIINKYYSPNAQTYTLNSASGPEGATSITYAYAITSGANPVAGKTFSLLFTDEDELVLTIPGGLGIGSPRYELKIRATDTTHNCYSEITMYVNIRKAEIPDVGNISVSPTGLVTWDAVDIEGTVTYQMRVGISSSYFTVENGENYLSQLIANVGTDIKVTIRTSTTSGNYSSPSGSGYTFITVYSLTISASTNGKTYLHNIDLEGIFTNTQKSRNVISGGTAYIYAEPDTGYEFSGWGLTSGTATIASASSANTTITVNSNTVISASFSEIPVANYTVNHFIMNTNGVYLTSADYSFTKQGDTGSTLILENLKNNSETTMYEVDNGIEYDYGQVNGVAGNPETTTISGDGSRVINLYYKRIEHDIVKSDNDNCTITTSSHAAGKAYYGEVIGISFEADDGYTLITKTVNGLNFTGTTFTTTTENVVIVGEVSMSVPGSLTFNFFGEMATIKSYTGDATSLIVPTTISRNGATDTAVAGTAFRVIGIEANVFAGNTSIISIALNDIETIESNAFRGATALTTINNADNLLEIGADAFNGCSNLTSINSTILQLETIYANAFRNCTNLVKIGSTTDTLDLTTVGTINKSAFYSCTALKTIKAKASATIGNNAFGEALGSGNGAISAVNRTVYIVGSGTMAANITLNSMLAVDGKDYGNLIALVSKVYVTSGSTVRGALANTSLFTKSAVSAITGYDEYTRIL